MQVSGLKISIIGAVRSGVAAAKLALRAGAIPFVSDFSEKEKIADSVKELEAYGIKYEAGGHTDKVYDCDIMVTSPGVPDDSPVLTEARKRKIKIISELEFAASFYSGNIIGITGTNGKTTTTTLMEYALDICGKKVKSAGNIGRAFSDIADTATADEFVALEISSFQLDYVDKFSPEFAVLLNITPDHLDRYKHSFELYAASKYNITKNQKPGSWFIYNIDDPNTDIKKCGGEAERLTISVKQKVMNGAYYNGVSLVSVVNGVENEIISYEELSLRGEHNIYNSLAVIAVLARLDTNPDDVKKALATFPGVEHRLEFVREFNGIKFINDSKATNVDSVWYALRSFDEKLILILGGKDKGNNYDQIKEPVIKNVKKIYAIGSSREKVYDYFSSLLEVEKVDTLEECVLKGSREGKPGDVVLLSPACASFDMFKSYEHRGKVFKQAVNNL